MVDLPLKKAGSGAVFEGDDGGLGQEIACVSVRNQEWSLNTTLLLSDL